MSRNLVVMPAQKPSPTKGSMVACPPWSSHYLDGAGWSVSATASTPAASRAAAKAAMLEGFDHGWPSSSRPRGYSTTNCTVLSSPAAGPFRCGAGSPASRPVAPRGRLAASGSVRGADRLVGPACWVVRLGVVCSAVARPGAVRLGMEQRPRAQEEHQRGERTRYTRAHQGQEDEEAQHLVGGGAGIGPVAPDPQHEAEQEHLGHAQGAEGPQQRRGARRVAGGQRRPGWRDELPAEGEEGDDEDAADEAPHPPRVPGGGSEEAEGGGEHDEQGQ